MRPLTGVGAARDLAGVRRLAASLEDVGGDAVPGPFAGGFVGALAYDLGVAGEDLALPVDPWATPPLGGLEGHGGVRVPLLALGAALEPGLLRAHGRGGPLHGSRQRCVGVGTLERCQGLMRSG